MKTRFLSVFVCLLFTVPLLAQLQKGDISLQGALGLGYQWSAGNADGVSLLVNPSIAFMLSDHWLVGATFRDNFYPSNNLVSDGFFGPFARYYFNPSTEGNNYFVGSGVGILFLDEAELEATLTAGFNRFIAPNLSLETTVGYSFGDNNLSNVISAGIGLRSFLSKDNWRNRKSATSNLVQGTWLLGASDASLVFNGDFINTRLSPNFGYFLTNRFVIGMNSGFSYTSTGNEFNDFNGVTLSAQPFIRYYFSNQEQRLVPFGQFGAGYAYSKSASDNRFEIRSNYLSTHARLGANLFLASNVAFEFSLDLRRSFDSNVKSTFNDEFISEEFFSDFEGKLDDRELELGLNMGIQFFLFRK